CVQYRETDFAFASRLMEEEGIFYFFKHTAEGHQLVLANTPKSHPEMPGQSTVIFDAIQGGNRPDFRISEWQKVQEARAGKVTLWDRCFELPNKNLEAHRLAPAALTVGQVTHPLKLPGGGQREIYDYPGGYTRYIDGIDRGGGERPQELQKIYEENRRL